MNLLYITKNIINDCEKKYLNSYEYSYATCLKIFEDDNDYMYSLVSDLIIRDNQFNCSFKLNVIISFTTESIPMCENIFNDILFAGFIARSITNIFEINGGFS